MNERVIRIHTDGGSRGNPGHAACAFVIYEEDGTTLAQGSRYLGIATNNVAEYEGVLLALSWIEMHPEVNASFHFYLDSELVVKQLTGVYRVKDANLAILKEKILTILKRVRKVSFFAIRREKNTYADKLVNECLDSTIFDQD